MPITPFHFGPGLALKAIAPRSFSWTAFVAAQVFIDCETLYYILTRQYPLHREMHTFVGATAAGLAAGCLLSAIVRGVPRIDERICGRARSIRSEISARGLVIGGLIGGASHPLLDGMMHPDIRPFAPWTDLNPLLGMISLGTLHLGCMIAGMAGVALLWMRSSRDDGGLPDGDAGAPMRNTLQ